MKKYFLSFTLLSDAAFSRGDGLAGEVDSEIQYDELGCPFLSGRSLKGILVNECADLLSALPDKKRALWEKAAKALFGESGQLVDETCLHIGDACIPKDLRDALQYDLDNRLAKLKNESDKLSERHKFQDEIIHSLTAIRAQTALDADGVAKEHSLRSRRVILRKTHFEAELFYQEPAAEFGKDCLPLLTACIAAFRRAGNSRNRGLGKLHAWLEDENRQKVNIINSFYEGVKS